MLLNLEEKLRSNYHYLLKLELIHIFTCLLFHRFTRVWYQIFRFFEILSDAGGFEDHLIGLQISSKGFSPVIIFDMLITAIERFFT